MQLELDHLFICTAPGAPEAEKLIQLGLSEGPPNDHPGQGTANRRFAFANAMIELLWVHDPTEAQAPATAPARLWERWSGRGESACPFGICVRPADPQDSMPPFSGWEYRPAYLPRPLSMHIGDGGLEEPMWVYLSFLTRAQRQQWFREHPAGIREITRLTLHTPLPLSSNASQSIVENGIIPVVTSPGYMLEIEFDRNRKKRRLDLRPDLPLVFQVCRRGPASGPPLAEPERNGRLAVFTIPCTVLPLTSPQHGESSGHPNHKRYYPGAENAILSDVFAQAAAAAGRHAATLLLRLDKPSFIRRDWPLRRRTSGRRRFEIRTRTASWFRR